MVKPIRVGVLASGGGTDLQSIIDAANKKMIDALVVVVISDKKDAYAMKRAEKHGIPSVLLDPKNLEREMYDKQLDRVCEQYHLDLIVGAGYMRILSSFFVEKWYGKLINIHPALLPSFKGVDGQKQAFEYGVKLTGCTTHFMDGEMDHGPIILQAAVQVHPDDTQDSLKQRILDVEHQILPRTIQLFAEKRLKIHGRIVQISPGKSWLDDYPVIPNVLYSKGY
jgi:phosphoribosylglycinamide formyltransferase-1